MQWRNLQVGISLYAGDIISEAFMPMWAPKLPFWWFLAHPWMIVQLDSERVVFLSWVYLSCGDVWLFFLMSGWRSYRHFAKCCRELCGLVNLPWADLFFHDSDTLVSCWFILNMSSVCPSSHCFVMIYIFGRTCLVFVNALARNSICREADISCVCLFYHYFFFVYYFFFRRPFLVRLPPSLCCDVK